MDRWMLYGATGFTGRLLAEEAVRRGLRPLLAGRSEEKLAPLAERLGLRHLAVSLDDGAELRRSLEGVAVVLHAAGPFIHTSEPMVQACLDAKASYLDITGELPVFQRLFSLDGEARARGVALIPGVGFDVVPTDCLARYVAERLPGARSLELAVAAVGEPTAGTAKSALGIFALGGRVRRGGALRAVPLGKGIRRVRFPERDAWAVPAPMPDLETAFRSTGIPDITFYMALPSGVARGLRLGWPVAAASLPLARALPRSKRLDAIAERLIERRMRGPSEETRREGRSFVWARAAGDGREVEAWLETKEAYAFTAASGVLAAQQTLAQRPVGATTPALAFGADFVLQVEGTRRMDRLSR